MPADIETLANLPRDDRPREARRAGHAHHGVLGRVPGRAPLPAPRRQPGGAALGAVRQRARVGVRVRRLRPHRLRSRRRHRDGLPPRHPGARAPRALRARSRRRPASSTSSTPSRAPGRSTPGRRSGPCSRPTSTGSTRATSSTAPTRSCSPTYYSLFIGRSLAEIDDEMSTFAPVVKRVGQELVHRYFAIWHQAVDNLLGKAADPAVFEGARFDVRENLPLHVPHRRPDGHALRLLQPDDARAPVRGVREGARHLRARRAAPRRGGRRHVRGDLPLSTTPSSGSSSTRAARRRSERPRSRASMRTRPSCGSGRSTRP